MKSSPYVGALVLAVVPKSTNGGLDHAPAFVTRVHPDGTVNLHTFVDVGQPVRIEQARLVADRAAAVKLMADNYGLLPGGTTVEAPDGTLTAVPGRNSTNGEPWNYSDVAHWVRIAYWGDGTEPVGDIPASPAAPALPPASSGSAPAEARATDDLAAQLGQMTTLLTQLVAAQTAAAPAAELVAAQAPAPAVDTTATQG